MCLRDCELAKTIPIRARAASALAQLAAAWERLDRQKRIIRGKPLPGSLRPSAEPKRKPKSTPLTFTDEP